MFFIGGLNSILPYIIYLSIIWVVLLVNFCGKYLQTRQTLPPAAYYSESHTVKNADSRNFQFRDHTRNKQELHVQKGQITFQYAVFFPAGLQHDFPEHEPDRSYDFTRCSLFGFRGPPSSALLI